jgi:hypothetical protein
MPILTSARFVPALMGKEDSVLSERKIKGRMRPFYVDRGPCFVVDAADQPLARGVQEPQGRSCRPSDREGFVMGRGMRTKAKPRRPHERLDDRGAPRDELARRAEQAMRESTADAGTSAQRGLCLTCHPRLNQSGTTPERADDSLACPPGAPRKLDDDRTGEPSVLGSHIRTVSAGINRMPTRRLARLYADPKAKIMSLWTMALQPARPLHGGTRGVLMKGIQFIVHVCLGKAPSSTPSPFNNRQVCGGDDGSRRVSEMIRDFQ